MQSHGQQTQNYKLQTQAGRKKRKQTQSYNLLTQTGSKKREANTKQFVQTSNNLLVLSYKPYKPEEVINRYILKQCHKTKPVKREDLPQNNREKFMFEVKVGGGLGASAIEVKTV